MKSYRCCHGYCTVPMMPVVLGERALCRSRYTPRKCWPWLLRERVTTKLTSASPRVKSSVRRFFWPITTRPYLFQKELYLYVRFRKDMLLHSRALVILMKGVIPYLLPAAFFQEKVLLHCLLSSCFCSSSSFLPFLPTDPSLSTIFSNDKESWLGRLGPLLGRDEFILAIFWTWEPPSLVDLPDICCDLDSVCNPELCWGASIDSRSLCWGGKRSDLPLNLWRRKSLSCGWNTVCLVVMWWEPWTGEFCCSGTVDLNRYWSTPALPSPCCLGFSHPGRTCVIGIENNDDKVLLEEDWVLWYEGTNLEKACGWIKLLVFPPFCGVLLSPRVANVSSCPTISLRSLTLVWSLLCLASVRLLWSLTLRLYLELIGTLMVLWVLMAIWSVMVLRSLRCLVLLVVRLSLSKLMGATMRTPCGRPCMCWLSGVLGWRLDGTCLNPHGGFLTLCSVKYTSAGFWTYALWIIWFGVYIELWTGRCGKVEPSGSEFFLYELWNNGFWTNGLKMSWLLWYGLWMSGFWIQALGFGELRSMGFRIAGVLTAKVWEWE